MAMTDLTRSTYSGEFGFLIVEPTAGEPGNYDREVLLAARRWEGMWVSMQDLRKGPPPDNGLEVMYHTATLGQRMLGHDEPIRVRQGERLLFRLLNASATMEVALALPGHRFTVLALDGNPVPTPASVEVLKLDVAERADVIVEMNNPGVWVFGSTDDEDRNMGMGVVIEYENRQGEPQWIKPSKDDWAYATFAKTRAGKSTRRNHQADLREGSRRTRRLQPLDHQRQVMARHQPAVHGAGGQALPAPDAQQQRRRSSRAYPPAHFRGDQGRRQVDVGPDEGHAQHAAVHDRRIDFIADDPGATLFHCHHQDHMDEGFAGLITYL